MGQDSSEPCTASAKTFQASLNGGEDDDRLLVHLTTCKQAQSAYLYLTLPRSYQYSIRGSRTAMQPAGNMGK
jgi:hypothetical protein